MFLVAISGYDQCLVEDIDGVREHPEYPENLSGELQIYSEGFVLEPNARSVNAF
jgi:hypothetical protein